MSAIARWSYTQPCTIWRLTGKDKYGKPTFAAPESIMCDYGFDKNLTTGTTGNEIAQKYTNMIYQAVVDCVIATNQTYVDSLKKSGSFDEAAQKEAFNRTMNAIMTILSDDAKEYITEATGDLNTYLTQLIESEVNKRK